MATFSEKTFISEFNILPNGNINVRKTTEILKDDEVVSQAYWRCVLTPNDEQANTVLGDELHYLDIANYTWSNLPAANNTGQANT